MDFPSYVDEVVKEYKRMRILDLADPKWLYELLEQTFFIQLSI